jgi:hypothetical protein
MATEAQIEANRKNAIASTGPQTPEGKSKSSRNAVSHGLFSNRDILNPAEQNEFSELAAGMQKDLAPEGTIEQTFAAEITRAAFRLRRCANVEDSLFETDVVRPYPSDNSGADYCRGQQIAVDRARAETHRILKRSMDELRRLQNERRFRLEVLHEGVDSGDLGLASYKDLMPAMAAEKRWQRLKRQEEGLGSFQSMLELAVAGPAAITSAPRQNAKQSQSAAAAVPETAKTNSTKQTQSAPRNPLDRTNPFAPEHLPKRTVSPAARDKNTNAAAGETRPQCSSRPQPDAVFGP